jgi:hypothetical protein
MEKNKMRLLKNFIILNFMLLAFYPQKTEALNWVKLILTNRSGTDILINGLHLQSTLLLRSSHEIGNILNSEQPLEYQFLNLRLNGSEFNLKLGIDGKEVEFQESTYTPYLPSWRDRVLGRLDPRMKGIGWSFDGKETVGHKLVYLTKFENLPNILGVRRAIINASICEENLIKPAKTPHPSGRSDNDFNENHSE